MIENENFEYDNAHALTTIPTEFNFNVTGVESLENFVLDVDDGWAFCCLTNSTCIDLVCICIASLSWGGYTPYTEPSKSATKTNDAVEGLPNTLRSLDDNESLYIYGDCPCTNIALVLILHPFMGRKTVIKPKFQFSSCMA